MNEKEILIKAANTLNDTAFKITIEVEQDVEVEVEVKINYFFFKRIKKVVETKKEVVKKEFYVRGATLRTMNRISGLILSIKTSERPEAKYLEWLFENVAGNTDILARCIATAIHNKKSEVPEELVEMLLDSMDANDILTTTTLVIEKLNILPFMTTIALVRSMDILSPKTEEQASPTETEGIIASGEQLEALSSILGSATMKS